MASEIAAALRIHAQLKSEKLTLRPLRSDAPAASARAARPEGNGGGSGASESEDSPSKQQAAPSQLPSQRLREAEPGWEGRCCVGSWDCDAAAALEASHWFVS